VPKEGKEKLLAFGQQEIWFCLFGFHLCHWVFNMLLTAFFIDLSTMGIL
jgi:hypothetical protein